MILESGFIIFLGLVFLTIKLPRRVLLRALNYPLALDIGISVLAYILHYGTFSGMMAAATAGMMASGYTTLMRWGIGWIDQHGVRHVGHFRYEVRA